MATRTVVVQQFFKPIKILKWKVREGNSMTIGRILLVYQFEGSDTNAEQRKLKSTHVGIVSKILGGEGAVIKTGEPLLELKACIHPTVMIDMCAECGTDLRKENTGNTTASVPMVHSIPELKVSEELAQKLGKVDLERLLKDRKLVLLVDLDQTLIHTTNDNIPANIKDVFHFQLYGPTSPWYHTRFRPRTNDFLFNISQYFELHICTFGARNYAHMIATLLDPDQQYFSNRILSRDECFDPTSKKANLKALFPCGDDMVCIIDDREDVWSHALNLIHVKPYHFFQHTGDINAPPGLNKQENDDQDCVDFTKFKVKAKKNGNSIENNDECEAMDDIVDKNLVMYDPDLEKVDVCDDESSEEEHNGILEDLNEKSVESSKNEQIDEENNLSNVENDDEISKISKKVENVEDINVNKETEVGQSSNKVETVEESSDINDEISEINESENSEVKAIKIEDTIVSNGENNTKNDTKEENNVPIDKNASTYTNNTNKESTENKPIVETDNTEEDGGLIDVDDPDDYLLYLEDILKRIHITFYEEYDKRTDGSVPDLKQVIPRVRSLVLANTKLVFSGLVPTQARLQESRAYQVAEGLGAEITNDLRPETTHLVAVRAGTSKVNAARKRETVRKSKKLELKVVTSDWLWCCAERWERVREEVFPLDSKGSKNRHPPPHCGSPEHNAVYPTHDTPAARKRTPSGRFMDTINPLMSFSSDDIADMDKEVEDMLDSEDSDTDFDSNRDLASFDEDQPIYPPEATELTSLSGNAGTIQRRNKSPLNIPPAQSTKRSRTNSSTSESSSSSDESLTGEFPRGFKRSRDQRIVERFQASPDAILEHYDNIHAQEEDNSIDEFPSAKFRRGEEWGSDLDIGQGSNSDDGDGSEEPRDDYEDGEWNVMGAALEREFLSNN